MTDDQREQARREAWERQKALGGVVGSDADMWWDLGYDAACADLTAERDALAERVKLLEKLVLDIEGKYWFDMPQSLRDRISAVVGEADRG